MATVQTIADRVRVELGDLPKSFVTQFMADGTTNRFRLHYSPLDANGILVFKNNVDISSTAHVEESTGVMILDDVPDDGDELLVTGNYYRYFTQAEVVAFVTDAFKQHSAKSKTSTGSTYTITNLPPIEEYPVAVYAVSLALYTLATDSAFDIDIQAPDGVSIPRAQRYRQLTEMVQMRQEQYRELCKHLDIGMYKIDVFVLNRISKATGRLIPVYTPQEVDDRSYPDRVDLPHPTYGDRPEDWPTEGGELLAYQGRAFATTIEFTGTYDPSVSFVAKILNQRGSPLAFRVFDITVTDDGEGNYSADLFLSADKTLLIAERTYWSIQLIDPELTDVNSGTPFANEVKGGKFLTVRRNTTVL